MPLASTRSEFLEVFKELTPVLLVGGVLQLLTGLLLKSIFLLATTPGILVMLPALMNLRGALEAEFAARLGTAYHIGAFGKGSQLLKHFASNDLKASIAMTAILSVYAGVVSFAAATAMGVGASLYMFVLIAFVSSMAGTIIVSSLSVAMVKLSIRRRLDPDNVTIPVMTAFSDAVLALVVFIIVMIFWRVLA
ncbi:magnesium transporter [Candidatus Micrarchaeota archaeon]|nr:magnesium transporter [Candidatus Micrarchaeota archaeon]